MEEYFYVVDDDDKVIGKEERSKCHETNLIHRAIYIFIFNEKDELLLQKRSQQKDLYKGCWGSSVGGHVEYGEGYLETAKRELKEELGTEIPLKEHSLIKTRFKINSENAMIFTGESEGPFDFSKEEIDEIGFFPINKIKEMIKAGEKFSPHFIEIFKRVCHYPSVSSGHNTTF